MSAMGYNLKKYLKFTHKKGKSEVGKGLLSGFYKITCDKRFYFDIRDFKIRLENTGWYKKASVERGRISPFYQNYGLVQWLPLLATVFVLLYDFYSIS